MTILYFKLILSNSTTIIWCKLTLRCSVATVLLDNNSLSCSTLMAMPLVDPLFTRSASSTALFAILPSLINYQTASGFVGYAAYLDLTRYRHSVCSCLDRRA